MDKRSALFLISLLVNSSLQALTTKPWLGNLYEFEWQTDFTYSRYRRVEGAAVQLRSASNDKDLLFDLSFTPFTTFDVQVEVEFADTPRQALGLRSTALQVRYQWLDDISGDPLSLTTGFNLRGVSRHSLKDVSCPYASDVNFELSLSMGKEWSNQGMWTMRTWGLTTIGIANHGFPWTRELFIWQFNWQNAHRLSLFTVGDFGFGNRQHVNVRHFDGWGKFQHQSIDIGIAYGYTISVYGILTAAYTHRLFAHNFPQSVNFFTIAYRVPFSFF